MTTETPSLAGVAAEVRLQIFSELLKDEVFEVEYRPFGLKWHDNNRMSIAKVCSQFRDEAIQVFQEQSIIQVDSIGILALKGHAGMFNRNRLRRIRLVRKMPEPVARVAPPVGPPVAAAQPNAPLGNQGLAAFVQQQAASYRAALVNRRNNGTVLSNGMHHCLDVFFDLHHLQIELPVSAKLHVQSSSHTIAVVVRKLVRRPTFRADCFRLLLSRDRHLPRYLDTIHAALELHDAPRPTRRPPPPANKIEVTMPLVVRTETPNGHLREYGDYGSITIDMRTRSLVWLYNDKEYQIADFGWA